MRESWIIETSKRSSYFKESYLLIVTGGEELGAYPHVPDEAQVNIRKASCL